MDNKLIIAIIVVLCILTIISLIKRAVKLVLLGLLVAVFLTGGLVYVETVFKEIKEVVASEPIQEIKSKIPEKFADHVKVEHTANGVKLEYKFLFFNKELEIKGN